MIPELGKGTLSNYFSYISHCIFWVGKESRSEAKWLNLKYPVDHS
jgi:hypothetical protein